MKQPSKRPDPGNITTLLARLSQKTGVRIQTLVSLAPQGKWTSDNLRRTLRNTPSYLRNQRAAEAELSLRSQNRKQPEAPTKNNRTELTKNMKVEIRRPADHILSKVFIHVGPTNSGKTHDALLDLIASGHGVYAGPLRLLAREVYHRLDALSDGRAGLITGEEHINTDAPFIAATTEAAPMEGATLVIDECHWLSDRDRGWAWTRLLLAGKFNVIHVICDPAAEDLVRELVADAKEIETIRHDRLGRLNYEGSMKIADLPPKSAIVAFSRKAVLAIKDELISKGRKPVVLYGALPPAAREMQIEQLISGEADILITTDVIGHGINLPLDVVALAEMSKFDGTERRPLLRWEAAQIVGRAGRYPSGIGKVYTAKGLSWFSGNDRLLESAVAAANGDIPSGLNLIKAPVRPTLQELGVDSPDDLIPALELWATVVRREAADLPLSMAATDPIIEALKTLKTQGNLLSRLDVEDAWALVTCPIDDLSCVVAAAQDLLGKPDTLRQLVDEAGTLSSFLGLAVLESKAALARNLRALTSSIRALSVITRREAAELEEAASQAVVNHLTTNTNSGYGTCNSCHRPCPPWFDTCQDCYQDRRFSR